MIDVADKQVFVPPLFTLAVALASELDKAILPAELITAIRQHDEALDTEEASVNVIVLGSRWAIKAGGRAYVIRRAKRSLLVFHHPDGASEEESG
jgi:hypothetical protein